jgi:hypothetical protein
LTLGYDVTECFDCLKLKTELLDNKIGKVDLAKGHLRLHRCKEFRKHELYIIFPLSVVWDISPLEVIKLSNFKVVAFVRVLKFENLTIERICFSYDQNVKNIFPLS